MTNPWQEAFVAWAQNAAALRLGSVLLHFLWQGAILAAVAVVFLAVCHRARPQTRYLGLLVIFLLMAACPLATFFAIGEMATADRLHDGAELSSMAVSTRAVAAPSPESGGAQTASSLDVVAPLPHAKATEAFGFWEMIPAWLSQHRHWIVTAWLGGVCLLSLRLIIGVVGAERARRLGAKPPAPAVAAAVARLVQQMGVRRAVRVLESSLAELPTLVGWLRPVILLPTSILSNLSPAELEAILAHELAHIRRPDYLVNLLQTIIETLLFYHPAIWWLSRRIRHERELCCDDMVIEVCRDRITYARALTALETLRVPPHWAVAAGGGPLLNRIRRIIGLPQPAANGNLAIVAIAVLLTLVTSQALPRASRVTLAQPPSAAKSAAKQDAPEKAGTQAAAAAPWATYEFQVVTAEGEPVSNTTVTPWQIGFDRDGAGGGSFGLEDKLAAPLKTDAAGKFSFVIPADSLAAKRLANARVKSVGFHIDHPDHPLWTDYTSVLGNRQIELADAVTLEIRVRHKGQEAPPQNLYPSLSGKTDWSEKDGFVTIRRVDQSSKRAPRWLRIVQAPPQGQASFSDLIDLAQDRTRRTYEAPLKPSVRVTGRLADNVPSPIKSGRIVARISSPFKREFADSAWYWSIAAPIAADGTFVMESVPADEDLQLIALCNGWVSVSQSQQEVYDYNAQYATSDSLRRKIPLVTQHRVNPRLYRVSQAMGEIAVPMDATLACEINVSDRDGKPIAGARVGFYPNQYWYDGGSQMLGESADSLAALRKPPSKEPFRLTYPPNEFAVITDAGGIAKITNLPNVGNGDRAAAKRYPFHLSCEGYEIAPDTAVDTRSLTPSLTAELLPGEVTKISVRMQKK